MKKVVYALGMLAALAAVTLPYQSCDLKDKIKEETGVDLDFDFDGASATYDVPVITDLNNTVYPDTTEVPLELASKISAVTSLYGLDDISSVTVTDADVTINNSDNENDASNFETMLAIAYSDSKPDPVTISSNDVIPDTHVNTIDLVPSPNVNLLDYMKSGTKLYYTAGMNMRKVTNKVLNCTLKVKYHVDFK